MRKGKLSRLLNSDNTSLFPLRTTDIEGTYTEAPIVGERFFFFAEPLNKQEGYTRVVSTSLVTKIFHGPHHMTFKTTNSTYALETYPEA
jgi:hypothetical protein